MNILAIILFFVGSTTLSKHWRYYSTAKFERHIFNVSFLIRLAFVIFIVAMNNDLYGTYYESSVGDILFYVPTALDSADMVRSGSVNLIQTYSDWGIGISDMGYLLYLTFLYLISGSLSIVYLPLILKCVYGALSCLFIYRIAKRHWGHEIGCMASIFCMLQFDMIWWCGSMMKETEMVFLVVAFIEVAESAIHSKETPIFRILLSVVILIALFMFRALLPVMLVAGTVLYLLFNSEKMKAWVKASITVVIVGCSLIFAVYSNAAEELVEYAEALTEGSYQQGIMEWRANRAGGNSFARYANKAIFMPLIFSIPFPTMAYTNVEQEHIMQKSSGSFEKNILSFFVILALLMLFITGKWRDDLLPLAFLLFYLIALAVSGFAQSGRYHMPAMPILMMFAAYGVSCINPRNIKWFNVAILLELAICIVWSWFKLAGRGMV